MGRLGGVLRHRLLSSPPPLQRRVCVIDVFRGSVSPFPWFTELLTTVEKMIVFINLNFWCLPLLASLLRIPALQENLHVFVI